MQHEKTAQFGECYSLSEDDLDTVFRKCSSVDDIESKLAEFMYDRIEGNIVCEICQKTVAGYGIEEDDDFMEI